MNSPLRHKGTALKSDHSRVAPTTGAVNIGINAVVVAMRSDEPVVALAATAESDRTPAEALPGGIFCPATHQGLDNGLRSWVYRQTGLELGFLQQLGTFDDSFDEAASQASPPSLLLSICYLALVGPAQCQHNNRVVWRSWYTYFPWEDWRRGKPECLKDDIEPRLEKWATSSPGTPCARTLQDRTQRLRLYFGCNGGTWNEEKVLERYRLLVEAGILGEIAWGAETNAARPMPLRTLKHPVLGDHGRVLASAIGELRRTIKWCPALFELMPDVFTLFELQKTVEALLGPHLHKQNFRRLVESSGLVEPVGQLRQRTGGRPAQLYRFRRDVLLERLATGVRVRAGRA